MSFFAKLRSRKKCSAVNYSEPHQALGSDSNTLHFGSDHIRILLFQECEQRGRRLLFDSILINKSKTKNKGTNGISSGIRQQKTSQIPKMTENQFEQLTSEDVGILSEMVFGTVAMTYKGPSFKIHSIQFPPCIMCTKVFPDSEQTSCSQRNKLSDETLGRSNSSSGSVTQSSRPSSGYISGNSLSPENVKSSASSSVNSGWNVEIPPPSSSNQSIDKSSSSSIGSSISSIRRRWLRAVSTSFSFTETDDMFGYYGGNIIPGKDNKRRKTRLGLTLLIRLTPGCEKMMENKLLEHAALLEGMLDRLRYCCIEPERKSGSGLVERLQEATSFCTAWLLHLFKNENDASPLLWHDVLLYSIISNKQTLGILHQNLEQMCYLLDKIDTKSTNFFLSTFVTAILTHHLGWIRTVIPNNNHKSLYDWEQWYPYNPLWGQLGDLHGALGNPVKVVQTVIAGAPSRINLINSVLTFASYFLRSGIVEKKPEERYSLEEDLQKSIIVLRDLEQNHSSSLNEPKVQNPSSLGVRSDVSESFKNESAENKVDATTSKLKRTATFQKQMNIYGLTQNINLQQPDLTNCNDNDCPDGTVNNGNDYSSMNVQVESMKLSQRRTSSLGNLNQFETVKTEEAFQNEGTTHSCGNFVNNRHKAFHSSEDLNSERRRSVYFTLGDEDVSYGRRQRNMCQCARPLPSWSESPAKTIHRFLLSQKTTREVVMTCETCHKNKIVSLKSDCLKTSIAPEAPFSKANDELQIQNCDLTANAELSLKDLLQRNCVIELPMPKSLIIPSEIGKRKNIGFTKSLLATNVSTHKTLSSTLDNNYIWGMIMQGVIKKEKNIAKSDSTFIRTEMLNKKSEWWWSIQEDISILAKCPILDQPIDEAMCILADLDTWKVGLLSNKLHMHDLPLHVGMSRLVSNMLEAFLYIWKKYRSPKHCIALLETRLREMWLRSEVLAEMMMVANVGDVSIDTITKALDLDVADLPLLLAVATTHTPEIAQRFGLSFA